MSHLQYYKTEDRATIRIERMKKHNALTIDDWKTLRDMIEQAGGDKSLRSLTITGEGRKTFSAGADLSGMGDEAAYSSAEVVTAAADAVEACPLPVIAALNGGVYGGAIELALACDYRFGVEGMKSFVPAARIGLRYHPRGIERYVKCLGGAMARRFLLATEEFDTDALKAMGFVDFVVKPNQLDTTVMAWCARFAKLAPEAVTAMKQCMTALESGAHTDDLMPAWRDSFLSDELIEGLHAVAEGRPAAFAK